MSVVNCTSKLDVPAYMLLSGVHWLLFFGGGVALRQTSVVDA